MAGMVVTAGGIFAASFGSAAVGLPIMIAGAATVGAAAVVAGASLVVDGLKNKNNKVGPQEDAAEVERGLESEQGLGLAQEMEQTHANSRSRPVTPTGAQNVAGGREPRSVSDYDSSSEYSATSTTEGERNR